MAISTSSSFPAPAFCFTAEIEKSTVKFAEISGLKSTIEFKEVRNGGANDLQFKIPTKATYGDVVFKRGIMKTEINGLNSAKLFKKVFTNILKLDSSSHFARKYKDIAINLTSDANPGSKDNIVVQWLLVNPCLISWEISPFNASANELAFETLTFSVSKIEMSYK